MAFSGQGAGAGAASGASMGSVAGPWGAVAGGVIGGIAGGFGSSSKSKNIIGLDYETNFEKQSLNRARAQYTSLYRELNQGAAGGFAAQRDARIAGDAYGDLLAKYASGNFRLNEQQQANYMGMANNIFAPQEQMIRQGFAQQQQQSNQMAARMGRRADDPILAAKLAEQQQNQLNQLYAQKQQFIGQAPLQFAGQLAQVREGLASQAMKNRLTLLELGSQLNQQERNFRLSKANRQTVTTSGGGLAGMISGGLAGAGAGANIFSMFGGGTPKETPTQSFPGSNRSDYEGF